MVLMYSMEATTFRVHCALKPCNDHLVMDYRLLNCIVLIEQHS